MSRTLADPLSDRVQGPVLVPGAPGFEEEVAPFNRAATIRPDVVVGATSTADVVAAVQLAREHGHRVSVQATGHGAERSLTSGVLVTTRRLDGVQVDPAARTATVGAGVRWEEVVTAAAAHGLAPVAGSSTNVGVVGYLLGGGLGPLARSHGFSSDHLVAATVVTGTGEVLEVDADTHPELLWALRGGKHGLGVVTQVRIGLAAVPELYAGSLTFAGEHVEQVLRGWLAWTAGADDATTTSLAVVRFPDLDVLPEHLRGQTHVHLRFARPGSAADGEAAAAPLRALAPVLADELGPMPLTDTARIHADPTEPGASMVAGLLLTHADDDLATAWLAAVGPLVEHPFVAVELRHVGGATTTDVPGGSAVAGRGATFAADVVAADPRSFPGVPAALDGLQDALRPWLADEVNPNLAGALTPRWHPGTSARLDELRRRHDPDGVLAPPAGEEG
ncbi:FAD-binding oxidoreductase [Cellulomonas fimi]|uniref:FAD linked oxidase domain protein n=1 Tax=Cellulomonas fimi (strain ATCC 484 / DSM 20113 / JCM 1341 / CCUG 24087 / LMG 16345 / NBRC 15513 / NCIMB 8980 / NCTC 7547 / NRS-133) TaxID=590998 RepID=F4H5L0_CELFA|nr:FAD-dependent oxidoreductase [Cellulomonas fimi]AEE44334.1 FAD linked oxidase domain protein [Cellulomonas fimi ATCC 484]NNH08141.1 FAD-binding oxidoreductase [Cellulomonas fimi]VEH26146.1 Mitomycin radical oxidase [Cellulomonas fimi]